MVNEKNNIIINKIIDDMILEIEKLFMDKENLLVNIKVIKELTMVLKELEKLYDNEQNMIDKNSEKDRNKFLQSLFDISKTVSKKQKRYEEKRKI